ncbi:MAG: endonuclease/exonuclease/phosphatase family protein [Phycisphaerales bacterium]|nr:endonuclease/exonuclease/phosphatase family protein [Phycisphaerales bacterium]
MRVLTWNILHGGGRERLPHIAMAILEHAPDLVVVTEARRRFAGQIAGALADGGLGHALLPEAPDGVNGVMLVSREPLHRVAPEGLPPVLKPRWLHAAVPRWGDMQIVGIHLPEAGKRTAHAEGWRHLLREARRLRDAPTVLAGDLNTWRDGPEHYRRTGGTATNLGRLASLGYADAWSPGEDAESGATWKSYRGEAFRLDYVLVSGTLAPRLGTARVIAPGGGARLSDHAAVVVDIADAG